MKAEVRQVFRSSLGTVTDIRCKEEKNSRSRIEYNTEPEIIFTRTGYYCYHTSNGSIDVNIQNILLANEGSEYRVTHGDTVRDTCTVFRFHPNILRELEQTFWTRSSGKPLPGDNMFHFPAAAMTSTTVLDYLHFRITEQWDSLADSLRTDVLLLEFLEHTFRILYSKTEQEKPRFINEGSEKLHLENMERAKAYILRHLDQDISLTSIAKSAYMSEFHFSRLFKELTGCSPYQYLIGTRLQHAALLLRETSVPVTEICFASGFRSFPHFITTFGRTFGSSPSRFRRETRG